MREIDGRDMLNEAERRLDDPHSTWESVSAFALVSIAQELERVANLLDSVIAAGNNADDQRLWVTILPPPS